jgi:hypothetical protein
MAEPVFGLINSLPWLLCSIQFNQLVSRQLLKERSVLILDQKQQEHVLH